MEGRIKLRTIASRLTPPKIENALIQDSDSYGDSAE
jgi:hypothetical protein